MQKGQTHSAKTKKLLSKEMKARWKNGTYNHIHEVMWSGKQGKIRKEEMSKRMKSLWRAVKRGKRPSPLTGKYVTKRAK